MNDQRPHCEWVLSTRAHVVCRVSLSLSLSSCSRPPSLALGQSQSPIGCICLFVCIVLANIMAPIAAATTKTTGRRGIAHNIGASHKCGSGSSYVAASVSGCKGCCCWCNPIFVSAMFLTLTKWLRLLLWHVSLQQPHKHHCIRPHTHTYTHPIHKHAHRAPLRGTAAIYKCVSKSAHIVCCTHHHGPGSVCLLGLLCLTGAQFSLTRSTFNKALHFSWSCMPSSSSSSLPTTAEVLSHDWIIILIPSMGMFATFSLKSMWLTY